MHGIIVLIYLSDYVLFYFVLFIGSGKTSAFVCGDDGLKRLNTSPCLLDLRLLRYVGRMIGHGFINCAPPIGNIHQSLISMLCNEDYVPSVDDLSSSEVIRDIKLVRKVQMLSSVQKSRNLCELFNNHL